MLSFLNIISKISRNCIIIGDERIRSSLNGLNLEDPQQINLKMVFNIVLKPKEQYNIFF